MRILFTVLFAYCAADVLADELSPYAGEENRSIKSLSESEIRGLQNGEGMGFARLAELNSYPGPRHVLDLSEELGLNDEQMEQTEALFAEMRRSAIATGAEIIEAERRLDARFAAKELEADSLQAALTELGLLKARLRYVHLEAHLRQRDILTDEQIEAYDRLRGYRNGDHEGRENHRHDGHH